MWILDLDLICCLVGGRRPVYFPCSPLAFLAEEGAAQEAVAQVRAFLADKGVPPEEVVYVLPEDSTMGEGRSLLQVHLMTLGGSPKVISKQDLLQACWEEVSFWKRLPEVVLVGHLSFFQTTLLLRSRSGLETLGVVPVGVLDLVQKVRQACQDMDEDSVMSMAQVAMSVWQGEGRVDTGGFVYGITQDLMWFRDRLVAGIEDWLRVHDSRFPNSVMGGLFGPGAVLLNRFFGEAPPMSKAKFRLQDAWANELSSCIAGFRRAEKRNARKQEIARGRRWVSLRDAKALKILDSIDSAKKELFLSTAIRRFAESDEWARAKKSEGSS